MSKADFFKEVREQKDYKKAIEMVPYAHFLGITFNETSEGLVFTLPFAEKNIGNPLLPALHGGALGGFMENAAIMHLMWTMDSLALPKNIDFTIDYILSGRPKNTFAICKVIKLGKRIANVQIEAWQDEQNNPIAIARSHFKIFRT
ncbi:MAG: PaaI family thioesterase [SAR324 cluster bacterium]|nr:PaaI family thioesterase [SAR324 cluster bacterium]